MLKGIRFCGKAFKPFLLQSDMFFNFKLPIPNLPSELRHMLTDDMSPNSPSVVAFYSLQTKEIFYHYVNPVSKPS